MIPHFEDKSKLYDWLRANKSMLIAEKKAATKFADSVYCVLPDDQQHETVTKATPQELMQLNSMKVKVVINTTNIRDSHKDVHIPGIWKKSLSEKKNLMLLKEHVIRFENLISDSLKASTQLMTWKDLGFDYEGTTQALIFDAEIDREDSAEGMFERYAKGKVNNHSVGMQYVQLALAINSDSKLDKEEKKVWDKYINDIANKDEVMAEGYFWAVTEAKIIEGSAVLMGSNFATPTLSAGEKSTSLETDEAEIITSKEKEPINWNNIANAIKNNLKN